MWGVTQPQGACWAWAGPLRGKWGGRLPVWHMPEQHLPHLHKFMVRVQYAGANQLQSAYRSNGQ